MKNKTVCLVDDEDVFHWIVRENLKKMGSGCEFHSFYNGDEMLDYLTNTKNSEPDIILLDLNMPVCNGWKFLDSFGELGQEIRETTAIYIVSSSIDPKDKDRADGYPYVTAFDSKPITRDFLEKVLDSSISSSDST